MKTLVSYRPSTIQSLPWRHAMSDLDRYFESFLGDSLFTPATRSFSRLPAMDVRETEKSYVVEVELPGYDEKDIEVHVDGGSLSIATKQRETKEETRDAKDDKIYAKEPETWILRERRVSSFSRSFKLPENANPEEVTAEFKNGVLSMEIKKRAEAQKRVVHINNSSSR